MLTVKHNTACLTTAVSYLCLVLFSLDALRNAQVPGLGFVAGVLKIFLEWVEDNPGQGAVAFASVYVFTTVCFIPGSLLTLGAGLVFGRALGTGLGVLVGSIAVLVSVQLLYRKSEMGINIL